MKTYKTYAGAKLANPECDIYLYGGEFYAHSKDTEVKLLDKTCKPESPSDHLMTLKEFLGRGFKLVNGDLIMDVSGRVLSVGKDISEVSANTKTQCNIKCHILSAACFGGGSHPIEPKAVEVNVKDIDFSKKPEGATHYYPEHILVWYKYENGVWRYTHKDWKFEWIECVDNEPGNDPVPIPRMRETYVKDTRSINEIAKAMIDGETLYNHDGSLSYFWLINNFVKKPLVGHESDASVCGYFFKKVLTPIDERQEWIDAAHAATGLDYASEDFIMIAGRIYDAGLAKTE